MKGLKITYDKKCYKIKQKELEAFIKKGNFISVYEYLEVKAYIIERFKLNQNIDYYEIEIRTIDKLLRKKEN